MLAALLASGCSTLRFAYDNADTYLRWQAGTYFDLQGEQADELDDRIDAFLAWHRQARCRSTRGSAQEASRALRRRAVASRTSIGVTMP